MKKTIKSIKKVYFLNLIESIILFLFSLVYSYYTLRSESDGYEHMEKSEYLFFVVAILTMMVAMFLGLKMFKIKSVQKFLHAKSEGIFKRYLMVSILRIAVLQLPFILHFVGYVLFNDASFAFCMAMSLIALFFCLPSEEQMRNDLQEDMTEQLNQK